MAVTGSAAANKQRIDPELAVRDVVERFRNAYDRRDVDGALELFADDAVLVFAPRAFKGRDDIRHGLEWDARLSPTSKTRLSGIEVLAKANVAVVESVVEQTAEGIGYECPVVTVIELGDDRKIRRMSSYYDRLAIIQQVANKSLGLRGGVFKRQVLGPQGWGVQEAGQLVGLAGGEGSGATRDAAGELGDRVALVEWRGSLPHEPPS